jgi:hypothetical protein
MLKRRTKVKSKKWVAGKYDTADYCVRVREDAPVSDVGMIVCEVIQRDHDTRDDLQNRAELIASTPLILAAAEWAFNVLQDAEDYRLPVSQLLSDEGRAKWAEYVKAIRQVDPNEPLLPRER